MKLYGLDRLPNIPLLQYTEHDNKNNNPPGSRPCAYHVQHYPQADLHPHNSTNDTRQARVF